MPGSKSKKTNVDIVSTEFEKRLMRFDTNVVRGRSMSPEQVEETRKRMQAVFDRTVESLKQCAAVYRAHNKIDE
jgi:hypothetical protein